MLKRIFRKNISTSSKTKQTVVQDESEVDNTAFGLKELLPGINPIVDIVAVHGLNGHRENTWTADNGINWLKDLLPNKIPNARILTFGYDARTHGFVSKQHLHDHGIALVTDLSSHREFTGTERRPIIFIAHSLGGIICKMALIHASMASESHLQAHKSIHLSTYGILYSGTPHQGGNGVALGKLLVNIASVFVITNKKLLKHLEMNSEMLMKETCQYNAISSHFKTKFFYETNETITPFGPIMIVPKYSAVVPGAVNAEEVPINKTHVQMVRYHSAGDEGFRRTFTTLAIMLREAASVVENKWRRYYRQNDLGPFITSDITNTRITSNFDPQASQHSYETVGPQRGATYIQGVMYTAEVPNSRSRLAIA